MAGALCSYCIDLSIDRLFKLMQEDHRRNGRLPPPPASLCYEHHASFHGLELAAKNGCALCQLILDCFKWTAYDKKFSGRWPIDGKPSTQIGKSMYSVAKSLQVSDVRICLNIQSVMSPWRKDSRVDEVLVRVGAHHELPLIITSPRESQQIIGSYRIGIFETDLDLGSEINYSMMRSWLQECQLQHPHCLNREPPELPTRVIDVGVAPPSIEPECDSVRLLCSQGMRAPYIALSHCWGGRINNVLKQSNLAQFQVCIPSSSLARNFRDAIAITRNLGIRYLWIDSLCIIQDSRSDWEKESKKMGLVYVNAFLTISAMAAKGSDDGILVTLPTVDLPKPATVRVFSSDEGNDALVRLHLKHPEKFPSWHLVAQQSPLNSRGWVLQEKILSPRSIHFGSRAIYWKCPQVLKGSDGAPIFRSLPYADEEHVHIGAVIHANIRNKPLENDPELLLHDYYRIVQDYASRQLTIASDKLPAIAGIASSLSPVLGTEYLAGLWCSDIHYGLLWSSLSSAPLLETYRAPSWSWASRDGRLWFGSAGRPEPPYTLDEWTLQILEHYVSLRNPDNPFGEVTGGRLVVHGWVMPLVPGQEAVEPRSVYGSVTFDEPKDEEGMCMYLSEDSKLGACFRYQTRARDSGSSDQKSTSQLEVGQDTLEDYIALMVVASSGKLRQLVGGGLSPQIEVKGLVLCNQGANYQRVGCFNCSLDEDSLGEWPQMWVKKTLVLV